MLESVQSIDEAYGSYLDIAEWVITILFSLQWKAHSCTLKYLPTSKTPGIKIDVALNKLFSIIEGSISISKLSSSAIRIYLKCNDANFEDKNHIMPYGCEKDIDDPNKEIYLKIIKNSTFQEGKK